MTARRAVLNLALKSGWAGRAPAGWADGSQVQAVPAPGEEGTGSASPVNTDGKAEPGSGLRVELQACPSVWTAFHGHEERGRRSPVAAGSASLTALPAERSPGPVVGP